MQDLQLDSLIQQTSRWISSEINEQTVIMNIESGEYLAFEEVGTSIWKYCEVPITISSICDKLITEYEVGLEQCRQETMSFIRDAYDRGLIQLV